MLEQPLTLPDSSLNDGLFEKISDCESAARPVPDTTLDGRLREGNTYLEHSAPGVSLDSGLMEGMSCLEPLEQSVHSPLVARPIKCVTEERSDWKPVINPVHNFTLDGQLREGNTYLERSALGVSLDSGLMEGTSCLEPLEQSVLSLSLVARPIAGIMEKVSEWKPVINPVQDITPDGRPMEGTTYLEHSALGVSVDSGLRVGMSSLEPVQQLVLNTSLVARPEAGIMKSDWKPVINPVQDITPDSRPMDGTTYLEHSALGVSLDSGLMEGMSRPEPLEQSVLGALSVVQPDETDTSERPALASQMNHEQSRFKSSARPMLDPDKVDNADVNADVNTDLPENSALMRNLDLRFWQSNTLCPSVTDTLHRRPMEEISGRLLVKSPGLALAPDSGHVKYPPNPSPFEQVALGVNRRSDNLDSCDEPQFGSDSGQSSLEWEDIRY